MGYWLPTFFKIASFVFNSFNSHRFGTTWGWVNDRIFFFGWTIPLIYIKKNWACRTAKLIESVGRLYVLMGVGGHGCHDPHFHGNSEFSGVCEQFVLWKRSLVQKKLEITCSRYSKNKENSLIIIGAHRVRCTPNSTINYS